MQPEFNASLAALSLQMHEAVLIRVEIQDFSYRPFQKQSFWSSDRKSCISMFVAYQWREAQR